MTPESEQWLLDGDCSKCRRAKYCGVYCTKGKQRRDMILRATVVSAIDRATGGAYSAINNELNKIER
jgi:hypothetical protein